VRSRIARARWRVLIRTITVGLSLGIIVVSAFGWVQLRALDRSTPTASVIDAPPPPLMGEQNILLVGLDSRTDALGAPLSDQVLAALHAGDASSGGDTADSLTVVHVPAGGGRATAISIPRDAYVDLGDGTGKHKINSAWARASRQAIEAMTGRGPTGGTTLFAAEAPTLPREDDPAVQRAAAAAGARATIRAVQNLTGLPIAHFAAVNLAGFADISTAIGGVGVCLRAPVQDDYSGVALPGGPQQISGPQALAFVRQRHGLPGGDLDRIARQQVFLGAATQKLTSAGTLADPFAMSRISAALSRSVTLDAGWDVLGFADRLQGLSAGAVTFRTIPTGSAELSTSSDGTAVQVVPAEVRAFTGAAIAADAGDPAAAALLTPSRPVALGSTDASSARALARFDSSREDEASGDDEGTSEDQGMSDDEGTSDDEDASGSQDGSEDGAASTVPAMPPAPFLLAPPITAAAPGCVN
jgi:LCP family protein required for cell wall assembly